MTKLIELEYELLSHLLYSLDLAPCDYNLFPNLKQWLITKRFHAKEEVIVKTYAYFGELRVSYYKKGTEALELVVISVSSWKRTTFKNKCKFPLKNIVSLLKPGNFQTTWYIHDCELFVMWNTLFLT